jgi:hypothetical protein
MTRYPDMLVSSFSPPAVKIHCSCVSVSVCLSVCLSVSVSLTRTACREPKRWQRGTPWQSRRIGTPRRNKISRGRSRCSQHSVSVPSEQSITGFQRAVLIARTAAVSGKKKEDGLEGLAERRGLDLREIRQCLSFHYNHRLNSEQQPWGRSICDTNLSGWQHGTNSPGKRIWILKFSFNQWTENVSDVQFPRVN